MGIDTPRSSAITGSSPIGANSVTPMPKAPGVAGDSRLAVTFALTPKQVQAVALAQTVAAGLRLALQPRGTAPDLSTPKPSKEKS